ncbi:methyl-accepting chemotaxis protein [Cystobacter ferrugineus]|uniref:Methyl-accepting transducer domain-containing protein n=1 Tax=Cystobacter ferrugineus TaxID=83449 RepID=A0A1L9BJW5_9BACT|nr:methyl-accepting chemotaxis protein [Cystobacter ferrugineus]OJH42505.1 hypothetical protein BON30_04745 [Cystobacter ferrugineus]
MGDEEKSLLKSQFAAHVGALLLGTAPQTYLQGLVLGLEEPVHIQRMFLLNVPCFLVIYGLLVPLPCQVLTIRHALARVPGEPPGRRLVRLLELPRNLEMYHMAALALLVVFISTMNCLWFDRSLLLVVPCTLAQTLFAHFVSVQHVFWMEERLRPLALEELGRAPEVQLPWRGGIRWRTFRWYLPYTVALTFVCTLVMSATILWSQGRKAFRELAEALAARGLPDATGRLARQVAHLGSESLGPMLLLGAFLLVCGTLSAWWTAEQIARGARACRDSIERMALGAYHPPEWSSPDELGRLSVATASAFQGIERQARRVRESADALGRAAQVLDEARRSKEGGLSRQAAALEEMRVVSETIQRASLVAAQKAEKVLAMAGNAGTLLQTGETASAEGLTGLTAIREQVSAMRARVRELERHAGGIRAVAFLVKEFADQSRMISLNAELEAVRASDGSLGFRHVALKLRALAEQSIQSTLRVAEIVQGLLGAIRETVRLTDRSAEQVEASLRAVPESGEALHQLGAIIADVNHAAWRISTVTAQQREGILQLSQAVAGLSQSAAETLRQLEGSSQVTRRVEQVAGQVRTALREWGRGEVPSPETSAHEAQPRHLLLRGLFLSRLACLLGVLLPLAYLGGRLLGLDAWELRSAAARVLLPLCVLGGVLLPWWMDHRLVAHALAEEPASTRLERLLELPRRKLMRHLGLLAMSFATAAAACCVLYGRSLLLVLPCTGVLMLLCAFAGIPQTLWVEACIRPLALRELHRHPESPLSLGGVYWRRLRWYLPYLLGLTAACTLVPAVAVLARMGIESSRELMVELGPHHAPLVHHFLWKLLHEALPTVVFLGSFLTLCAGLSAWRMARQLDQGARELESSISSIAAGNPRPPAWISTDELGSLAVTTLSIFQRLWTLTQGLHGAAGQLGRAATELSASHEAQTRGLSMQMELLRRTAELAHEVERMSRDASRGAEAVLEGGIRAGTLHQSGLEALARGYEGLTDIRQQVTFLETRLQTLAQDAWRIRHITVSIKNLSDESDVLALNAAITAMQSGEPGQSFGVVAREVRVLADRSLQETREAARLLQELLQAIDETEAMVREGSARVQDSLARVDASGETLRQLFALVQEGHSSARQIAATIHQQGAGIAQVSQTVADVSQMMGEMMERLATSARVSEDVDRLAEQLRTAMRGPARP